MTEIITAYITKYALTEGILELRVELVGDNMVKCTTSTYPQYFHREGRDWHRTKESAIARAEVIRATKLKSIEKQIKRIKELRFDA